MQKEQIIILCMQTYKRIGKCNVCVVVRDWYILFIQKYGEFFRYKLRVKMFSVENLAYILTDCNVLIKIDLQSICITHNSNLNVLSHMCKINYFKMLKCKEDIN